MSEVVKPPSPADQTPRRSKRRVWALRALKLTCSVTFGIVLLEVALRIVGIWPITAAYRVDRKSQHPVPFIAEAQEKGWFTWPTAYERFDVEEHSKGCIEVRHDSSGFREDTETPIEKPTGTYRIIVTGDSHTDGVVFNSESYANVLESALDHDGAVPKVDVINAGFGRSSPYQQLWAYEKVFRRFSPDALVVGFYAGNDVLDCVAGDDRVHLERIGDHFVHAEAKRDIDPGNDRGGAYEKCKIFLRGHSAIYAALARTSSLRRLVRAAVNDEYRERLEAAQAKSSGATWQGLNQAYYFHQFPERWEGDAVPKLRHILGEFQRETREDHADFVLLVIPTRRQIDPTTDRESQPVADVLGLRKQDLACDERACDLAVRLAGELGIVVIDLRGPFREAVRLSPRKPLYYRFDHHLNAEGHRLAAKELEKHFRPTLAQAPKSSPESKSRP